MYENEAKQHGWLFATPSETSRKPAQPMADAVSCLREARVLFAVLPRDLQAPQRSSHLDVLVDPGETEVAVAAVRRPGFREVRRRADETSRVFLTYEDDRFFTIALHPRLAHRGLELLDAARALSRRDVQGPWPRLSVEDRFLQLLLSLALQGPPPTESERLELLGLRREGLSAENLAEQTRPLGLQRAIEGALPVLDALLQQGRRWDRFRLRLWWAFLRRPGNRAILWRRGRRRLLQMRYRPVVLAVMGPPGVGKSDLIEAIREQLAHTPLKAGRVPMSCWAGGRVWRSLCQRLAPVEPDFGRLWRGRRGGSPALTEEEWRFLREVQPTAARLLAARLRQALRRALFDGVLQARLGWRIFRGIWRCRRAVVLTDGWAGDWGTRLEAQPSPRASRRPAWLLRRLPLPDGILYRSTSYTFAASRKPQLQREQFESVDLDLRRMLRSSRPLEFIGDESPRHVARTFLRRYWAHVLERHNHHA